MRVATGAVLTALAACSGEAATGEPATATPVFEGSIEVVDLAGLEAALGARQGQALLVNFWAIWCVPCVQELPDLVAATADFRARGGEVIGVSLDLDARGSSLADVQAAMPGFLARRGIDFPILIYDDDSIALGERFELQGGIPETLAFDRSGARVASHWGRADREEFEALAERALAK